MENSIDRNKKCHGLLRTVAVAGMAVAMTTPTFASTGVNLSRATGEPVSLMRACPVPTQNDTKYTCAPSKSMSSVKDKNQIGSDVVDIILFSLLIGGLIVIAQTERD